ncbi:MAG: hypothetical protein P8168_12230 [Deltaproteobacteria bacterium]|jgi:hypothetical protein
MIFLAFNLEDFHSNQDAGRTMVGVNFVQARSLQLAKELMANFYPGAAWAVVSKRTFDAGIVLASGCQDKESAAEEG